MGIETILGGASLVSGMFGASSAKKQAKTAQKQAQDELKLQERVYEESTARLEPWRAAGANGLSAYLYELGIGPKPTFGGTAAPTVETLYSGGSTKANPRAPKMEGQAGGGAAYAMSQGAGNKSRTVSGYRAGDKTFQSAAEAQAYADSLATPGQEYGGYETSPMAQYLLNDGMESIEGSRAAAGGLYSGATLKALEDNRRELITADTTDYFNRLLGVSNTGMSAAGGQNSGGQSYAQGATSAGRYGAAGTIAGYQGQADAVTGTINDMAGIYGLFGPEPTKNNPMASYAGSYRPQRNPAYI